MASVGMMGTPGKIHKARHEVMSERAKTVGSEEIGHTKEMPVKGSQWSTSYTVQKYPWCE